VTSILLSVPAQIGGLGIGQGGLKLARSFDSQGWEVSIIAAGGDSPVVAPFSVATVALGRILGVAARSPLRWREDLMVSLHYEAFDRLARRHVAAADVFYGYSEASLLSARRAKALGMPTVLHAANTYLPTLRLLLMREHERLGVPHPAVSRIAVRKVLKEYAEVDLIRAQSTLVQTSLLDGGVPEEKILFVPPAVDLQSFRPGRPARDEFCTVFVGAFSIRKGIHHLLDGWEGLGGNRGRLILHGGSGHRWADRLLAPYRQREDVLFRSGPPHATYHDASVCVVPSIEDGFCYVVLEAMASGVPVIVSEQVGAKDVVREGVDGFVIPVGDRDALAERLAHLRDRPSQRERMGAAARQRAEQYSFEREGRELVGGFAGLLRGKGVHA
jgi:glycosyltransferase involved in cell wall biosynthesis